MFATLGWIATAIYLGNHAWLSSHSAYRGRLYFALNFVGASGIVVSSWAIASWQAVGTNLFWALTSALALAGRGLPGGAFLNERWLMTPIFAFGAGGIVLLLFDFYNGMAVLGWMGTALFCAGYALFTAERIRRRRFLVYNIFAAYGMSPILYLDSNWPVLALEIAWGSISLAGWLDARRRP